MKPRFNEITRKCPKCKSRFGLVLIYNLKKNKRDVLCVNGDCDFKMNIDEWNKKYKRSYLE